MHILRPQFRMDQEAALDMAASRGFGLLVAADGEGPRGSHVPFVIRRREGGAVAETHVTAHNPLAALADGRCFLLVVNGPDAYVSNDWYRSPDQVSTWLYEAIHLSGSATRRLAAESRQHGDRILAENERRLLPKAPWTLDRMEPAKREGMLGGIVVIDLAIDRVEGQSKLNQHKIDADHVAVADRLAASDDSASRALAAKMRALRPGLGYATPSS